TGFSRACRSRASRWPRRTATSSWTGSGRGLGSSGGEPLPVRAGKTNLALDRATIEYRVDVAATAEAAEEAGRSGNPLAQVLGAALRRFRDDEVHVVASWNHQKLDEVLDAWDQ